MKEIQFYDYLETDSFFNLSLHKVIHSLTFEKFFKFTWSSSQRIKVLSVFKIIVIFTEDIYSVIIVINIKKVLYISTF